MLTVTLISIDTQPSAIMAHDMVEGSNQLPQEFCLETKQRLIPENMFTTIRDVIKLFNKYSDTKLES